VGGAGERRADLVTAGVVEDGGDVRVRADDPDLAAPDAEGFGEVAVGIDLGEADDADRAGRGCRGRPRRVEIRARVHQQQEPVARDLAEAARGA
jgi:hypothetical protein